ncbi:YhbY family RNA-binding protein [uncultured Selenomonas sp.]|uniref:YhbY family RNA-binding protein n=1 Tax=uncultured Selenomonas sp. TaxID=159275 RepID=UPI0028EC6B16|nr:YhbY family RNA-binding protein [uncultured Selenomonas sp.]
MLRNSLTSKQIRKLRSLGMTEEAIVMIGKEGVTPTVVASAREAIKKRELIKVRVLQNAPDDPEDAITVLAERADANLVQVIGRNGLLFRRNFDKPRIEL